MRSDACREEIHGSCRGDAYSYPEEIRVPCTCPCHVWGEHFDSRIHDPERGDGDA